MIASMPNRKPRSQPKPIVIGEAGFGLSKLGVQRFDPSDPYHVAVSLSWPGFAVAMLAAWLSINLVFATLYVLRPGSIANAASGAFSDAFFFSVETLATVGYGVMAPSTLYGHFVSAAEIVAGMAFTAIFTGLLFVRFSRPRAKIEAAADAVVTMHNGQPTLMLRIVNGRVTIMSNATVRLFILLEERSPEGLSFRRVHDLPLRQSHQPIFIMPWTLMHIVDGSSPLHGHDSGSLIRGRAWLLLTIEARDHALATMVQDIKNYSAEQIRFDMHFADMVVHEEAAGTTADMSRLSLLEPDRPRA